MTLCPRCHAEVIIPFEEEKTRQPAAVAVAILQEDADDRDLPPYQRFVAAWLGPNMRLTDNVIQGIFTLLCVIIASVLGYHCENRSFIGAVHGIIGGLIVGFLVGGFLLTVFRLIKDE